MSDEELEREVRSLCHETGGRVDVARYALRGMEENEIGYVPDPIQEALDEASEVLWALADGTDGRLRDLVSENGSEADE